jgi:KDO2-lipid IV(A) lauroyltransferase
MGPRSGRPTASWRRRARAALGRIVAAPLEVAARVLPAIPTAAVLTLAETLGLALWALDRRGRRVGMENLRVVFGEGMPVSERRRVLRASFRNVVTVEALVFHLQPLTRERYLRLVRIDPDDYERLRAFVLGHPRMVIVSGHYGNWELGLAASHVFPGIPEFAYLTETTGWPRVDALFDRLRDRGSGGAARRKHGAMALRRAIEEGRFATMLVDRNVRALHGGRWVPFLGLPARTTPLGALLARQCRVPLSIMLLLPEGRGRWRLWGSLDLTGPETDDPAADALATMARVNDVLSRMIRERPEAWAWMLKRWKSRPTPEQGPYPSYSGYDPDDPLESGRVGD